MDTKLGGEKKPPPKTRRDGRSSGSRSHGLKVSVRYNVGQVCRNKKHNYICVPYGWDIKSDGLFEPKPFYNVLVSDGTDKDVAQEDLELLDHPEVVTHPQLGKYFSQFDPKRGYVGNKQSKEVYPDDERH